MTTVMEWLEAHGEEDVDVYDCEVDIGRAWGLPYGDEDVRAVQGWILGGVSVTGADCGALEADVWGFVLRNLAVIRRYASEQTRLKVDASDEGVANGVLLVMMLMSGEAAADSYRFLAWDVLGVA